MMYGRVIRSEGYTGTLVSFDDSRSASHAGVVVVRDGDFAGVVAPTERLARRAAAAVRAEWRMPSGAPSSATVYEHLKKTARRRAADAAARRFRPATWPTRARAPPARSTSSYRIPYIAHVPLEPRAAVAEWTDGKLTVWTGTQRPFGVRAELAEAFHVPEERVRVIVPDTGPPTAASTRASTRSKRRGWRRPPASRSSSYGRARKSSRTGTSVRRA